jgi:hypothetical protein
MLEKFNQRIIYKSLSKDTKKVIDIEVFSDITKEKVKNLQETMLYTLISTLICLSSVYGIKYMERFKNVNTIEGVLLLIPASILLVSSSGSIMFTMAGINLVSKDLKEIKDIAEKKLEESLACCENCKYFSNNNYLPCTVNPSEVKLDYQPTECRDFDFKEI